MSAHALHPGRFREHMIQFFRTYLSFLAVSAARVTWSTFISRRQSCIFPTVPVVALLVITGYIEGRLLASLPVYKSVVKGSRFPSS